MKTKSNLLLTEFIAIAPRQDALKSIVPALLMENFVVDANVKNVKTKCQLEMK